MTNDIVSAISSFLTPELLGKLATACGLDRAMTQTAVSAAVPSILSGLARIAGSPGGARQLAAAVADQPTDVLGTIARNFAGSAQMAEKGTGVLSSLLGGSTLTGLASAVGKFAGIGDGPARTLMGLLTPLVMGVLGREQRVGGLDVNGLARMVTGQEKQIAAAMPPGFSRLIEASGLQQSIGQPRAVYEAPLKEEGNALRTPSAVRRRTRRCRPRAFASGGPRAHVIGKSSPVSRAQRRASS